MKQYRKELIFSVIVFLIFGFLIYLETQLPAFKRFIPVGENKLIVLILNINLLLILLLLFLVTRTLVKVHVEKKRGIWGSGLKTKLTVTLLFISIIPSFTLFVLATGFFHMSMDKWFSQKIEDTIDNALGFAQFYYKDMFQRYEDTGQSLAAAISRQRLLENEPALRLFIRKNKRIYHVEYLSVYSPSADLVKDGNSPNDALVATLIDKAKTSTRKHPIREIVPLKKGELVLSGTRIIDQEGRTQGLLLVGSIVKIQGTHRIKEIASASKEFKESRPFKKILKYSFVIPLFLITIMTIFFSVWVGIKMATEITVPLEKMKEGASIIARGKFDINLEDRGTDEIGTLVGAFNSMAKELKGAKEEVEEKRRYMEVILDNVATGIISTDKKGTILLLNKAAGDILGIDRDAGIGIPLREILGNDFRNIMKSFLKESREKGRGSVTREMKLTLNKDVTHIRASLTTLKDDSNRPEGFIITFDDITHVVRAEKLATWREVARKLTHEIKNPLTPIILSAERIRRKLLANSGGKEKEVLDETTSVIIKSVQDIKGIVNELTKLTHSSQAKTTEDINSIVEETAALYTNLYQNIEVRFERTDMPQSRVDRDGLKRAMINLITNSVKAIDGNKGTIVISTWYNKEKETGIIEIADTGCGIPDKDKGRIFDPYFTKDKEGTGLGLAIVHSIILEHHGKINVENNVPRGTRFLIELPIVES